MEDPRHLAVRCTGVTKTYGTGDAQVIALRGIQLDVHTGELLMLVGPSGCGKTTLISVIAGILDQDEGSCVVCDEPTSALDHETGHQVMELLRNAPGKDRALIVVTHDARIFEFSDRIAK